jgi:hypothetical protein
MNQRFVTDFLSTRHCFIYNALSVVVKAGATRRKVAYSIPDEVIFLNLPNPAALGPGDYSASNRNEYQKQKNNVSGE